MPKKIQKVAKKSCKKVAKSCHKLPKIAKSCQKLPTVDTSCQKLPHVCFQLCAPLCAVTLLIVCSIVRSQLCAELGTHSCVRQCALTIVGGIVNCVRQCLVWPVVEEVMSQGQGRLSTQEGLIMEPLFQWSKAKGNRIRGRLSICLMV